jgi:hypothetical protein
VTERRQDDLVFRSLFAPGLDEDDLFAALHGLPVPGAFWGHGGPGSRPDAEPWSDEAERRRRHEELLRKWDGAQGGAAPAA